MNEDQEWKALELVAPGLGVPLDSVRKIRPQDDTEYPDQTFDFAARRTDGTRLAIEITNAWDSVWISAQASMMRLAGWLTPKLADAGHYGLSVIGADNVPSIRSVDLDDLARKAAFRHLRPRPHRGPGQRSFFGERSLA